jgi:hypothetical protein
MTRGGSQRHKKKYIYTYIHIHTHVLHKVGKLAGPKKTNQNSESVSAACPKFGSPGLTDRLTKQRTGRHRNCVPAASKDLSTFQSIQTVTVVCPDHYLVATGTYFQRIKRRGRQVYDSSPPSAEVKKLQLHQACTRPTLILNLRINYTASGKCEVSSTLK